MAWQVRASGQLPNVGAIPVATLRNYAAPSLSTRPCRTAGELARPGERLLGLGFRRLFDGGHRVVRAVRERANGHG